ncbi:MULTISPECIES: hypothetical protein [Brevibacillus]|uniref:hypothetical protein n=1 Tax=Brevibacillus TaxID=55080 RepID=UPI000374A1B4|nr:MULTISPECIES: hypothetical protein [Brevibacillus]ATO48038.1 hypothetical protein BrL25_02265 [Brevibacillus laterosporus DSM 25]MBG9773619.1 hypothetical protein [Brevibacillus laterosporus]MBG9788184.1 hypothetical protein [Brevibacillus laterosporus]MBG9801700.1 hypothetical protein [Brevibacillus laterosporus]MBM7109172.1 hypothetical protein [Brevibacillus laterosporus]
MSQPAVPLEWQEHVRESILFGLLFKVAMVDQQTLRQIPLSLSYVHLLDHLSRWAERRHHYLRRALLDRGCEVIGTQTKGGLYRVQVRLNGYVHELRYSPELLRAECQARVQQWLTGEKQPDDVGKGSTSRGLVKNQRLI